MQKQNGRHEENDLLDGELRHGGAEDHGPDCPHGRAADRAVDAGMRASLIIESEIIMVSG
jgi:hypothetical protein